MSTTSINPNLVFNALSGVEVKEIILRKVREAFDKDERFRQHATYPNLKFAFSCSLKYEPGMAEAVNVKSDADTREKIRAQADTIAALQKQLADRDEKFHEIESQAQLLLADNEKKTHDLADANDFIKKLMAEKHAQPIEERPLIFDLDAIAKGEPIVVEHESEVIEEPDKLRESGETLNPETIEVEVGGEGEAIGEAVPQMSIVGRAPSEVRNVDPSLKLPTEGMGATVSSGRPPAGVKGRPRG